MRSEIRSLTGLRGLAALWVMVGHYIGDGPSSQTMRDIVEHMYLAVDLFMVLSGFVLARSSDADFQVPFSLRRAWHFLLRRLARVYPVYLLSSAVCGLLIATGIGVWGDPEISWPMVLTNLAMAQSWGGPYDAFNAVTWSISIEWAANLLFAVFAFPFLRASLGVCRLAALATIAGLLVYAALNSGRAAPDDPPVFGALTWYSYPGAMVRCLSEFMLGMACWRMLRDDRSILWLGGDLALIPILLAMAAMTLSQSTDILFMLLGCCLMLGFAQERSHVAALFAAPLPRFLGLISYSLYLWHIPLLRLIPPLERWADHAVPVQPWLLAHLVLMLLVIGVSALSYRWIERPAQKLVMGWFEWGK